jgi:hypothetical protein
MKGNEGTSCTEVKEHKWESRLQCKGHEIMEREPAYSGDR